MKIRILSDLHPVSLNLSGYAIEKIGFDRGFLLEIYPDADPGAAMSTTDTPAITSSPELFSFVDGCARPASFDELIDAARAVIASKFRPGVSLHSPALVKDFIRLNFAKADREIFILIFVDTQNRLIDVEQIAEGTIDFAAIYTREVVKSVLRHGAKSVLLAHNHPSGDPTPSGADRLLTERLSAALGTIDVRVLDHFVAAGDRITSFAERGWI